jgi:hypothetical protein
MMLIVNVILAYMLWKVADLYFDIGKTTIGWFCVIFSAFNFAAFLSAVI